MVVEILEIKENEIGISEKLYQKLDIVASDKGISVAEFINEYVEEGLKNAKI